MNDLYTIGHSTHTIDRFIELLRAHSITAVADVRSMPFSRFTPQFNQNTLDAALRKEGIAYVFVGRELGARAEDSSCYRDGKVQFGLLAKTALFREGLDRIRKGILVKRIALLCTEKDPITCHRTILVCRHLRSDMRNILHILEDGSTEDNVRSERRLMQTLGIAGNDLFASDEELIERVYNQQGETIAYTKPADGSTGDE